LHRVIEALFFEIFLKLDSSPIAEKREIRAHSILRYS
jgi:hypothetical protein